MLTNDNFALLSESMRSSGFSNDLIEAIRQNFVQQGEGSVSSGDMFAQTLGANTQFFSQITNAMAVIASGEDKPVEIGGLTIDDINSLTGMTVFTTQLNLVQAQMELINNMFNFVKQFEKSLTSVASG